MVRRVVSGEWLVTCDLLNPRSGVRARFISIETSLGPLDTHVIA